MSNHFWSILVLYDEGTGINTNDLQLHGQLYLERDSMTSMTRMTPQDRVMAVWTKFWGFEYSKKKHNIWDDA